MMIHEITELAGKYKARKRVGRGTGSGTGRRSGRGQKGASSRSGHAQKTAFEGGQMPYFRRLPKVGFSNFNFTTRFWIVNLRSVLAHPSFAKGGEISPDTLIKAGLIRDTSRDVKILGDLGDAKLTQKFTINAHRVSAKTRELVLGAGGTVNELGTRRDRVRGIDRNADDKSPKNLTKKLRRGSKAKKPAAPAEGAAPTPEKSADKGADKGEQGKGGKGKKQDPTPGV